MAFFALETNKTFFEEYVYLFAQKTFLFGGKKKTAGSDSIEMEQFRFVILIHQSVHNFVTWSISNANLKSILSVVIVVCFNNIKKRPIKKEFRRCNLI